MRVVIVMRPGVGARAQDVVQLMELEGRQLPAAARVSLQTKLRACRAELSDLRAELKAVRTSKASASRDHIREELFSPHGGERQTDAAERARMLGNTERITAGTDRLREVMVVTDEMESTGASILGDLAAQRQTLLRTGGTLSFASKHLDASGRMLRAMARRAAMNRAVLWVVIIFICAVILIVAYVQLLGGPAPPSAPAPAANEWVRAGAPRP